MKDGDKLLSALKRHNPWKVRVECGEETRDVAVPQRRRRWAAVVEAIEAKPWTRCELLDKQGAALGYVANDDAAGELEELGAGRGVITEAERIVGLVLKGQEATMKYRDSEVSSLLKAQGDVVRELTAAMKALSLIYQAQVDAASEVAALQATADAGAGGQLKELMDAAPTLLQLLPAVKQMLGANKS